jgi:hypothetical protein
MKIAFIDLAADIPKLRAMRSERERWADDSDVTRIRHCPGRFEQTHSVVAIDGWPISHIADVKFVRPLEGLDRMSGKSIDLLKECSVQRAQVASRVEHRIESDPQGAELDPSPVESFVVLLVLEMHAVAQVENADGFQLLFHQRKIAVDAIKIIEVCIHPNAIDKIKSALRFSLESCLACSKRGFPVDIETTDYECR